MTTFPKSHIAQNPSTPASFFPLLPMVPLLNQVIFLLLTSRLPLLHPLPQIPQQQRTTSTPLIHQALRSLPLHNVHRQDRHSFLDEFQVPPTHPYTSFPNSCFGTTSAANGFFPALTNISSSYLVGPTNPTPIKLASHLSTPSDHPSHANSLKPCQFLTTTTLYSKIPTTYKQA